MTIIIIPDLYRFIQIIYDKGVEYSKDTMEYKLFCEIVSNSIEPLYKFAVPYFNLFEDDKYIVTVNTCSKKNIMFDEKLKCYIFKNLSDCFYETSNILKILRENYPEDTKIEEKYNTIRHSISLIETSIELDEVYSKLSSFNMNM